MDLSNFLDHGIRNLNLLWRILALEGASTTLLFICIHLFVGHLHVCYFMLIATKDLLYKTFGNNKVNFEKFKYFFKNSSRKPIELDDYVDSEFAGDLDMRRARSHRLSNCFLWMFCWLEIYFVSYSCVSSNRGMI